MIKPPGQDATLFVALGALSCFHLYRTHTSCSSVPSIGEGQLEVPCGFGLLVLLCCRSVVDFTAPPQREWGASLAAFDNARGRRTELLSSGVLAQTTGSRTGPRGPEPRKSTVIGSLSVNLLIRCEAGGYAGSVPALCSLH